MKIKSLMIKNYRGLDIEIDHIESISTIIGQNDSGKSNICEAILKVLDFEKRKQVFLETDSTMGNKEPIEIRIKLLLDDLTVDQYAVIREYIHKDEKENKYVVVRLFSEYNSEILETIVGENILTSKEIEFNIFETKKTESNFLEVEANNIYVEEENDPDLIN